MRVQLDVSGVTIGNQDDVEYDAFLARVQARFSANIGAGSPNERDCKTAGYRCQHPSAVSAVTSRV